MPTAQLATRVWIEPGCIACDKCSTICPDVFAVRDGIYLIRPEARDAEFCRLRMDWIREAAEVCPVEVIRFETLQVADTKTPKDDQTALPGSVLPDARLPDMVTEVTRRAVVGVPMVGWLAMAGSGVVGALALQRFMMPNVSAEPDSRVRIGDLTRYAALPIGAVNEDYKAEGIVIVRLADRIAALSTVCTHLGCPVGWIPAERKFKCPCHGSGFAPDGVNLEGPAPRALERLHMTIEEQEIIVDRSKTFRQERGEWNDPESCIAV